MQNNRIKYNHIIASAVKTSSWSPTSESTISTQQITGSAFKKMAGKYGAARFKPASSHLTPSISRSRQTQLTSRSSCGLSAERPAAARRRPIFSRCCRQSLWRRGGGASTAAKYQLNHSYLKLNTTPLKISPLHFHAKMLKNHPSRRNMTRAEKKAANKTNASTSIKAQHNVNWK